MKQLWIIFIIIACATVSVAEVDLSSYNLTPEQIKIIRKIEAKGSDAIIVKLAIASKKHNEKEQEYIPPHTVEQLEQVSVWAVGGAFQGIVGELGLEFDSKAYMESYPVYIDGAPNMAIFNFGRATGDQFFAIDIMNSAISVQLNLSKMSWSLPEEQFLSYFLELAKKYNFRKYISLKN